MKLSTQVLNQIATLQGIKKPNQSTQKLATQLAKLDGKPKSVSGEDLRLAKLSIGLTGNVNTLALPDINAALSPAIRGLDTQPGFSFLDAEIVANQRAGKTDISIVGGTPQQRSIVKQAFDNIKKEKGFEAFNNTVHIIKLPKSVGGRFYPKARTGGIKAGDISINQRTLSRFSATSGKPQALQATEQILIHEIQHHNEWLAYTKDPRYATLAKRYTLYDEVIAYRISNDWLENQKASGRPVYFGRFPEDEQSIKKLYPQLYSNLPEATPREAGLLNEVYNMSLGNLRA
jgi:hypothetical protein